MASKTRYQVRYNAASRLWETWVLRRGTRSWERLIQSTFWSLCMWLATGDSAYAKHNYSLDEVRMLVYTP